MVELGLQRVIVDYINVGMQCRHSRSITNMSTGVLTINLNFIKKRNLAKVVPQRFGVNLIAALFLF